MELKYKVVLKDDSELVCDEWIDRKKFWFWFNLVKWEIKYGVVELKNGNKWIYYYGRYRWRWEKVF